MKQAEQVKVWTNGHFRINGKFEVLTHFVRDEIVFNKKEICFHFSDQSFSPQGFYDLYIIRAWARLGYLRSNPFAYLCSVRVPPPHFRMGLGGYPPGIFSGYHRALHGNSSMLFCTLAAGRAANISCISSLFHDEKKEKLEKNEVAEKTRPDFLHFLLFS